MRTETRKVLVEQEVYIAEDGTEFDDVFDCRNHEYRLIERNKLKLYDTDMRRSNMDDCWYTVLETENDVEMFLEICKYDGVDSSGIGKPGVYMYNDRKWVPISELVDILRNKAKEKTND